MCFFQWIYCYWEAIDVVVGITESGEVIETLSVISLAKLTMILPLEKFFLRSMDKNDGTVNQFVPSEISGTIQIKYNLSMNKNVRCE